MDTSQDSFEAKGFLKSLYDFKFESFITLRVIRALYVLITIVYSLGSVVVFVVLLAEHAPFDIVFALIGVPLLYLIYLTMARISLEFIMVVFNIGKDVRGIREESARQIPPA
jgi:hypothetical protein